MIALAVAGLGFIVYSMVKGSGPPSKPPSDCAHQKGSSANADSGCGNTGISLGCCPADKPKCCSWTSNGQTNNKCYNKSDGKQQCLSSGLCDVEKICPDPHGDSSKDRCCNSGICDTTSGKCISCDSKRPPCLGKVGTDPVTAPTCCDPTAKSGDQSCYASEESKTGNNCVCCGGENNGYGGKCCSSKRCFTKDTKGNKLTAVCCPNITDVADIQGNCCSADQINSAGKCITDLSDYCATVTGGKLTLSSCTSDTGACAQPSICFNQPKFSSGGIKKSPLYGKCSGYSDPTKGEGPNHGTASVCVNMTDYAISSFSDCKSNKCSSHEVCKEIGYYGLPSVAGSSGKAMPYCDATTTKCKGGPDDGKKCVKNIDCGTKLGPSDFTSAVCSTDNDCPGHGLPFLTAVTGEEGPCVELLGVDKWQYVDADCVSGKCTQQNLCDSAKKHVKVGSCSTPCPLNDVNPTTYCSAGERCLEYVSKDTKGNLTNVGYCANVGSPDKGSPMYDPNPTFICKDPRNTSTKQQCEIWCEKLRGGRCELNKDGNYRCCVGQCEERDVDTGKVIPSSPLHVMEGEPSNKGAKLGASITYNFTHPSATKPGTCYNELNLYGITDAKYDENGVCVGQYNCAAPSGKSQGILLSANASALDSSVGCGVGGNQMKPCTEFARNNSNLSSCNTCQSSKCSITKDACDAKTPCPIDPYSTTTNLCKSGQCSGSTDACDAKNPCPEIWCDSQINSGSSNNGPLGLISVSNLCASPRTFFDVGQGGEYCQNETCTPGTSPGPTWRCEDSMLAGVI